jgi:asparagine synthase (glutamine-hydrolysing)
MFRYMAVLWNAAAAQEEVAAEELARRVQALSPSWSTVMRAPGMAVLVADQSSHLSARRLFGGSGVVLGEIFPALDTEGTPVQGAEFDERETQAVLKSDGRILASGYWGNFVAFLLDFNSGARLVFKDACGSLPCHVARVDGVTLVFSCLGDCRELGLRFAVNGDFLRAKVVGGVCEVREESLVGVSSIRRGECARFARGGGLASRSLYCHWDFKGDSDLENPRAAARALRAAVLGSVRSMAARHPSVLAQISGGLDSSIVLGCLEAMTGRPQLLCYTLFIPDSPSDERRWARYAVQRGGYRHMELPLTPEKLIYASVPALAPCVQPQSYFTHWQKSPIERDLGSRFGATAVFTGDGGDSVFCSTSYVFAVDHCLRRHGLGFRTLETALRVARRRDRTVWNVLGKALARTILGRGRRDAARNLAPSRRLVSADVRSSSSENMSLETLLRMGPLAFTSSFYNLCVSHRDAAPCVVSPLCAQPVFEVCARIPVDVHFDSGRSRGLARRAFAGELPVPIARRQWKDRPWTQAGQVIRLNLPFIREHLLEGRLMQEGILDRGAVELALGSGPSTSNALGSELLSLLDLELWIRDCA